jgi:hypothetical protein
MINIKLNRTIAFVLLIGSIVFTAILLMYIYLGDNSAFWKHAFYMNFQIYTILLCSIFAYLVPVKVIRFALMIVTAVNTSHLITFNSMLFFGTYLNAVYWTAFFSILTILLLTGVYHVCCRK